MLTCKARFSHNINLNIDRKQSMSRKSPYTSIRKHILYMRNLMGKRIPQSLAKPKLLNFILILL